MPQAQDKVVEVPGVGNVSFPGGMADDAIGEAIKGHLARQDVIIDRMQAENPLPPPYYGFTPGNLLRNVGTGIKNLASGTYALGKDLITNPNLVSGTPGAPSTLEKFVIQPSKAESMKAAESLNRGEILPAIGHTVASGIPFVGPFTASLGEQAGRGDIGGAIGQAAGTAIGAMAVPVGTRLARAGLRFTAEPFMRTGLGFRRSDFGYGREPVQAVLKETSGTAVGKTLENIQDRLSQLGEAARKTYQNASAKGVQVSLKPAIDVLKAEYDEAITSRRTDLARNIQANIERLSTDPLTGESSLTMPPDKLWKIKTGQGDLTNWNPDIDPKTRVRIEREVYGAIKQELNRAVPEAKPLIDRYSNLRPAVLRASSVARAPGIGATTLGRLARPTGGSAVGLYELLRGNLPAAAAAILGPEFVSSPSVRIPIARALYRLGGGEKLGIPTAGFSATPPIRGLLGPGPLITPPLPDPSFVRGIRAIVEPSEAVRMGRLLPPGEGTGPLIVPYRGEPAGSAPIGPSYRAYSSMPQPRFPDTEQLTPESTEDLRQFLEGSKRKVGRRRK